MRVNARRSDRGAHERVEHVSARREIPDRRTVDDQLLDGIRMELQSPAPGHRIDPYERQRRDLFFLEGREVAPRELATLAEETEAVRTGARVLHPYVRMWSVTRLRAQRPVLLGGRQRLERLVTRDERGGPERRVQRVAGPVVVYDGLRPRLRHFDCEQRRHFRRMKVVKRRIDVPSVEMRQVSRFFLRRQRPRVRSAVRRMPELHLGDAFMVLHPPVAEELDLRPRGDRNEIAYEDALF